MIARDKIDEALYLRFIEPAKKPRKKYVGAEFELPIVNTERHAVDFEAVHAMTDKFISEFNFTELSFDDDGFVYAAKEPVTGDTVSFDCSYNTLEFSFGREESMHFISDRFRKYTSFADDELKRLNHCITGMGLNPRYTENLQIPVKSGRYRMLLHHLDSYKKYPGRLQFHDIPYFGLISCSAQTHVDVTEEDVLRKISVYDRLEPFKALLFSNSPMEDYQCIRDHFWRESMHGLNPRNVDSWDTVPGSIDELISYIRSMSIYCTERDGKYINFEPVPLKEYFSREIMNGEYFDGNGYSEISWEPGISDIEYLRSYKFADLTFRGTIELRSACMQPIREAMTVPAFNIGIAENLDEAERITDGSDIFRHGLDAGELRRLMVKKERPDLADQSELAGTLCSLVDAAADGLKKRGKGEEKYLEPLYERAEKVESPALKMIRGIEAGRTTESYIREYGL